MKRQANDKSSYFKGFQQFEEIRKLRGIASHAGGQGFKSPHPPGIRKD